MTTRWFQHLWVQGNRLFRSNALYTVSIIGKNRQLCNLSAAVEQSCPKTDVKTQKKSKAKRQEVNITLDLTDEQSQVRFGILRDIILL